jgi:hypothetical protein
MPAAQLVSYTTNAELALAVAAPWLRERAASAWKDARPTVVLTPSRAEGFYLRHLLVEQAVPLFGLRFWTPSDARGFLLAHYRLPESPATQADLRLLARVCAQRRNTGDSAAASSLSVARDPAAFLRAYELLLGAGWNPARDAVREARELARDFQRALEGSGILTQVGLHRALMQAAVASPRVLIADLLLVGFNALHWPLWDLLQAVVRSSERTLVALAQPRVFAGEVDQLWHSSWEEFTSVEIAPVVSGDAEKPAPLARLAEAYETGETADLSELALSFAVAPDLPTQVRAVVLRALEYLQRDDCTRLGLVFPQTDALALEIARELRRLDIPVNDGPGAPLPGLFERRSWHAWLALQDEPSVGALIAWVRACEAEGLALASDLDLDSATIAHELDHALGETLVDELPFLTSQLEEATRRHNAAPVAQFLRDRIALPAEATFAHYWELTRQAAVAAGWEPFAAELPDAPPAWLVVGKGTISRRAYLEWLRETTASRARSRGAEGNHFYGKVQLLVYGQLNTQTWSHLVLTGLNEGVWPRLGEDGAFSSRHEWAVLNRKARELNRRAAGRGRQGEGQEIVRPGFGHALLPQERHDLALRDLSQALEATSGEVCLCAIAADGGRSLLPSDFFNHAYQAKTGRVLDDETFRRLALATDAWTRKHAHLLAETEEISAVPVEATRRAALARRNSAEPFGEFEFAHARPPTAPIQLFCRDWEQAWKQPATAWLTQIIGARAWPDGAPAWPTATGSWTHAWLRDALRARRENGAPDLAAEVRTAAQRTAGRIRARANADGVALYPWWLQVWEQALSLALDFAEELADVLQGRPFHEEFKLPDGVVAALPGGAHADFELKGRLDLLLLDASAPFDFARPNLADRTGWVIDFKTGAAKALTAKKVTDGDGLQAVLYALALRALGCGHVEISLLPPGIALKEQVALDDALTAMPLFRSLELMHRRGIFGQRPVKESPYGYAPEFPLATRTIPFEVLQEKWARLHGDAARAGEEDE